MNDNFFILKSINNQLGELNRVITNIQKRLANTEACISNMSQTQATLVNRITTKPELVTPAESNASATHHSN